MALGISLSFLKTLPDPTYVLSPITYGDAELVTERDFQQVMSYDYEEKATVYRSTAPIQELLDHYQGSVEDEGWQLVSRSDTEMVFQHPVSRYTIFIEQDAADPLLIKATIRRYLFIH